MSNGYIDLAHVQPFDLGVLKVIPANRMVVSSKTEEFLEPRVMQVLVALAEARGAVLSHDDLIERCWNGRIVGDNAIQRAISRVREIAAGIGGDSFEIETIKGVGYRLKDGSASVEPLLPPGRSIPRRVALAGGAAAVVVAGLGVADRLGRQAISKPAREFFESAEMAARTGDATASNEEAAALYQAAVDDSPEFAEAWSGLALSLMRALYDVPDREVDQLAAKGQAAARRALAIDPRQERARAALVLIEPSFGRWDRQRVQLEKLSGDPVKDWEIPVAIGQLHLMTGDFAGGVPILEAVLRREPAMSSLYEILFTAYWRMGRLPAAEQLLDKANERWPRNYRLWNSRFDYLAMSGQFDSASLFVRDETYLPFNLAPNAVSKRLEFLDALESRDSALKRRVAGKFLADLGKSIWAYPRALSMLAALGLSAPVVEGLTGFLLGQGRLARDLRKYSKRPVGFIHAPFFDPIRSDPQFASLLSKVGLPLHPIV